jgi:hypothetical protein
MRSPLIMKTGAGQSAKFLLLLKALDVYVEDETC